MRPLVLVVIAACAAERAPVTVVSPSRDAAVAEVVVAPPVSASAAPVDPVDANETVMTLNGPVSTALLARLARTADAIPRGELHASPPRDDERDRAIQKRFGQRCHLERTCGALWGIDCEAAVDGPYFYVRPRADGFQEITVCGGACMGGRCKNCPPKNEGWTCDTY
jgi:hypothetical protein